MKKLFLIFVLCLQAAPWVNANEAQNVKRKFNPPLLLTGDGMFEAQKLGELLDHVDRKGVLNQKKTTRSAQFSLQIPNQPGMTVTLVRPIPEISNRNLQIKIDYTEMGSFKAGIKVFHTHAKSLIPRNNSIEKAFLVKLKASPDIALHIPSSSLGRHVLPKILNRILNMAHVIFVK